MHPLWSSQAKSRRMALENTGAIVKTLLIVEPRKCIVTFTTGNVQCDEKRKQSPENTNQELLKFFSKNLSDYFHSLSLTETVSYATILYENSVCSFLSSRLFLFRSKEGDAIEVTKVLKFTLNDKKSLISLTPTY